MKLFTGWALSVGLIFSAAPANAQVLAPAATGSPTLMRVSDVDGPYAAMPPEAPLPPAPRGGPMLLPPIEVYTVLRDNGFLPLGMPRKRGLVYTISVIGRGGGDGRLIIDARNGRIVRFVPGFRAGDNFDDDLAATYGPEGPLPPTPPSAQVRGAPRPPASVPHVASRTVPVPKPSPLAAKPAPAPAQQAAAVQPKPKPADAQASIPPAAAPAVVQAQPAAPAIQPTQEMPQVQGLE
jgi:hypothetical protein